MSGFKLLAIRPLEGCDTKFLKNLKEGMIYKFYQDYNYYVKDGSEEIKLTNSNYKDYNHKPICKVESTSEIINVYSTENVNINISAVVGKNGSGKSTLTELFFLVFYLVGVKKGIIPPAFDSVINFLKSPNIISDGNQLDKDYFLRENEHIVKLKELKIKDKNAIELYEKHYKLLCGDIKNRFKSFDDKIPNPLKEFNQLLNNTKLEVFYEFEKKTNSLTIKENEINFDGLYKNEISFEKLFYSIGINYSIYGLNSSTTGSWINSLFKSSEDYLFPLIIFPHRVNGNIKINSNQILLKSRFLGNLIKNSIDNTSINFFKKNKRIEYVKLTSIEFEKEDYGYMFSHIKNTELHYIKILNELFDLKLEQPFKKFQTSVFHYLLLECFLDYSPENISWSIGPKYLKEDNTDEANLKLIKEDLSYNSIEDKQVIYFLKYFKNWESFLKIKDGLTMYETKVDDLSSHINKLYTSEKNQDDKVKLEYFFPPRGIFNNIELLIGAEKSSFSLISSGERQQILNLSNILYEIRNVNLSNKTDYKSINIIFDEVELYFHPEYQRQFIAKLIALLKQYSNDDSNIIKNYNLLFVTHSPFILSDIPSSNVLKLKDGIPKSEENQSFAANIHDLLANDFFLEGGFMGEFAKEKINSLIDFLKSKDLKTEKWNEDNSMKIINLIGENLVKQTLLDLYYIKYRDRLEKQIKHLQSLNNSNDFN